jgi:hypothetical protein
MEIDEWEAKEIWEFTQVEFTQEEQRFVGLCIENHTTYTFFLFVMQNPTT